MPRGYRSTFVAVVAVYVVILLGLAYVGWLGLLDVREYQHHQAEKRSDAASYDRTHSRSVIVDRCINVSGQLDRLACVIDATRAEQDEGYTYHDLKAQQDMAAWTYGMLLVSIAGTVIAFGGLAFVAHTLRATREQVRLSRQALDADLRPWLSIESVSHDGIIFEKDEANIILAFKLRNHGRTPALDAQIEAFVIEGEINLAGNKLQNQRSALRERGVDKVRPFGDTFFPEKPDVLRHKYSFQRAEFSNDAITPKVFGAVFYISPIDGKIKLTEFAYMIVPETMSGAELSGWPERPYTTTKVQIEKLPLRPRVT